MKFVNLLILLTFISIAQKTNAQSNDTIIVSRDKVQIYFTNTMRSNDLDQIAHKLDEKEMSIRYTKKEFDLNGYLSRIEANIGYKNTGYEFLRDTLLHNDTKIGFVKDLLTDEADSLKPKVSTPFSIIEDVPIHPDCKNLKSKKAQKNCLSKAVQMHVAKKFNIDLAQELGLTPGKKRIFVMFKINKQGKVVNIIARGPHERLEIEAIRVVSLLPVMKPGALMGEPVGVKYSLPISFIVEGKKERRNRKKNARKNIVSNNEPYSIYVVDEVPVLDSCILAKEKKEKTNCLIKRIATIVENEFNPNTVQNIGVSAGRKRLFIDFIINEHGSVEKIKPYTDYEELKIEAIRAIKMLPKFIPAEKNGRKVSVKYKLPISFTIE